jgi:flagellar hook-associated protein 1 FlgK
MGSLFGSLYVATGSLLAQQAAISVTANNVSNINTPGYSRQQADLAEGPAYFNGSQTVGTGVVVQQIVSLRDRVLELRVQSELQQQGSLQSQVDALGTVNTQFSTQNTNLGDAINNFFSSLSDLTPDPSNSSLRQSVLVSSQNLASQFQSTSNLLTQQQFNLNLQIQQGVSQVNQATAQIASLNQKISTSGLPEDQIGTFVDQRNNLLETLSSLLGNNVITANDGLTVTASDGTALVVGNQSYNVDYSTASNGQPQVTVGGHDIGDPNAGGSINGLLKVRNQTIPSLLSGLDSLASNLITSFNSVHESGYDLNGNTGVDFFTAPPAGGVGAASAFSVNITSASQIAASGDGSSGSNSNLNTLLNLRNQPIIDGDSPTDAYSKLTFQVGSDLSNAQSDLQNSETSVQQLTDQRGALSGVSLDEEASNLVQFQRAYESAARVLTIISQLTEDSVNLGNVNATL